jgi:hypothetical protein
MHYRLFKGVESVPENWRLEVGDAV